MSDLSHEVFLFKVPPLSGTEHTVIRDVCVNRYAKWFADDYSHFSEYALIRNRDKDPADISQWLDRISGPPNELHLLLSSNRRVEDMFGHVSVSVDFHRKIAQLGVIIAEPTWRHRGIGTYALCVIMNAVCSRNEDFRCFEAYIHKKNEASRRFFAQLNFVPDSDYVYEPRFTETQKLQLGPQFMVYRRILVQ